MQKYLETPYDTVQYYAQICVFYEILIFSWDRPCHHLQPGVRDGGRGDLVQLRGGAAELHDDFHHQQRQHLQPGRLQGGGDGGRRARVQEESAGIRVSLTEPSLSRLK